MGTSWNLSGFTKMIIEGRLVGSNGSNDRFRQIKLFDENDDQIALVTYAGYGQAVTKVTIPFSNVNRTSRWQLICAGADSETQYINRIYLA